ncbi:MAG: cysteine desulfurase-like protein, partial [Anaerolineae bacterium]|nr:cysteine desulfurase-like protein [Anaerolineae bacterium]
MTFPIDKIRHLFPSLNRLDTPIFFDNPAGSQVPQTVIDAFGHYFSTMNANQGGTFKTSQKTDAMMRDVREKVADFLGATNADEIVFGANMTTLAFSLSRALAQTMKAGDEIILTRMDHDANIAPWLRIAEERGLIVRWVDINLDDCTLDLNTLEGALNDRTKLVATVHCSNAVGTLNPVAQIAQMAHAAGALCVVDAVQSAPHVPIDVITLGCDFLLCSAYKFFGPHVGILWGKYDLLEALPAYKVRPSKNYSPFRWETGTPNFEGIFALGNTIDYIQKIGQEYCMEYSYQFSTYTERAKWLKAGMEGIRQYEKMLISRLLDGLESLPNIHIFGITDRTRLDERCPTVVFTHSKYTPNEIAQYLANHDIYVWDGNYYALEIMARLGHSEKGMVRVGLAHYNTVEEIDRFCAVLRQLVVDDNLSVPQKLMQQEYVSSVTVPPQTEIDNHDIWEFMNFLLFELK